MKLMKYKKTVGCLVPLIGLIGLGVFFYFYGFALILWLFTPKYHVPKGKEKIFIDSIQKSLKSGEIDRYPKYFFDDTTKKEGYALIINEVRCAQFKDSTEMYQKALGIARKSRDVMRKSSKFTGYAVIFRCTDAENPDTTVERVDEKGNTIHSVSYAEKSFYFPSETFGSASDK